MHAILAFAFPGAEDPRVLERERKPVMSPIEHMNVGAQPPLVFSTDKSSLNVSCIIICILDFLSLSQSCWASWNPVCLQLAAQARSLQIASEKKTQDAAKPYEHVLKFKPGAMGRVAAVRCALFLALPSRTLLLPSTYIRGNARFIYDK